MTTPPTTSTTTTVTTPIDPAIPAMDYVEKYCNILLSSQSITERYIGCLPTYLKWGPVSAITSITNVNTGTALTDGTDFIWDEQGRLFLLPCGCHCMCGPCTIWEVVYVAGYGAIPGALQYLVDAIANELAASVASGAMQSETLGDYSYSLASLNTKPMISYRMALNQWRRMII